MTRLSSTLTIFIFLFSFTSMAQQDSNNAFTLPDITRPSPTVAALMKIEEVDLNHYTGQPNIAIPLFSKSIYGLNYNLALQYQVSGIRVDEQSGWVGKGWALETGGVISRSVVGLPDDLDIGGLGNHAGVNNNPYYDYWDWSQTAAFVPTDPSNDGYKTRAFYFDCLWASERTYDYHRDIYQFNFFGNVGRFIFVKEGNVLVPKIIGNDSKLKIEVFTETGNIDYPEVIKEFIVTDTNGFKYTFNVIEETTREELTVVRPLGGGVAVPTPKNPQTPAFRSAWKLSRVDIKENGQNVLTISYDDVEEKPDVKSRLVQHRVKIQGSIPTRPLCNTAIKNQLKPTSVSSHYVTTIDSKKVNHITFNDGISIHFGHSNVHPEYQGARLNSVDIKDSNGSTNKSYDFSYLNHPHQLLFLNEIKINNSNIQKYTFDYGDGIDNLKAFGETIHDVFGYYKSDYSETQYNDPIYGDDVTSGALKTITYPTGGKRKFHWESNSYSFKGDCLLSFSDIMDNPENYTTNLDGQIHDIISDAGGTFSQSNYQIVNANVNHNTNVSFDIDAGYQYVDDFTFRVYYKPILTGFNPSIHNINNYLDVSREEGSFILYTNDENSFRPINLDVGDYAFYIAFDGFYNPSGNNPPGSTTISIDLEVTTKDLKTGPLNWWKYGGGLRLNSVDAIDENETLTRKIYNYILEPHNTDITSYCNAGIDQNSLPTPNDYPLPITSHYYSSGSLDGEASLIRQYEADFTPIINTTGILHNPIRYVVTEYNNELTAQLTQGNFIGYKNVAEYLRDTSQRSAEQMDDRTVTNKSVTKFTYDSAITEPTYSQNYNYPFPYIEDIDYLRGNLKTQKLFNSNNQLVKSIENKYNFETNNITQVVAKKLIFEIDENNLSSYNYGGVVGTHTARVMYRHSDDYANHNPNGINFIHDICSGQLSTLTSNFTTDGYPFLYSQQILKGLERIYNEYSYKVQLIETETKDYFYHNNPISGDFTATKKTFVYDPDNYQIKEQHTYIKEKGIDQHYETVYSYPTSPVFLNTYGLNGFNRINEVLSTESFKNGNRISTVRNTFKTFNQSDTDPSNDITMVEKVQYVKGEGNPPSNGGPWSILNDMEDRIQFHNYDQFGNPLEISKPGGVHIVYIWGYNHTLPVAKIENTTYDDIESLIEFGTDFSIANSLSNNQEMALRSIPGAMVTTYKYDPMVGITSITDPRGYTIYYEYDDFNRLEYVIDNDLNILSKNEYNYRTQN